MDISLQFVDHVAVLGLESVDSAILSPSFIRSNPETKRGKARGSPPFVSISGCAHSPRRPQLGGLTIGFGLDVDLGEEVG